MVMPSRTCGMYLDPLVSPVLTKNIMGRVSETETVCTTYHDFGCVLPSTVCPIRTPIGRPQADNND